MKLNGQKTRGAGILLAVLAAALYALSAPMNKLLLDGIAPTIMAGLLYVGAGLGMTLIGVGRTITGAGGKEMRLTRAELPYTAAMVVLDIAAPIAMLFGLKTTSAASASLINNFEIVATALIAMLLFREQITKRLWLGIAFVTASCVILSAEAMPGFAFSKGALFIVLACVCWGFENNCTRRLSEKDPMQIVSIKGIFSGTGSLAIGLLTGERLPAAGLISAALMVGLVAYGLSIYTYVRAQRMLGAARTSAYYAVAPFIGVLLSLMIFHEIPTARFYIALALMGAGAWLSA